MDNQICALSERVARLEKSNRAMKVIVAVTVLAMTAMTSTPQLLAKSVTKMFALDADTITVQRINLVNSTGQIVAALGTSGNGAGLVFVDGLGRWLMALGTSVSGANTTAGLALYDGNAALAGKGVIRSAVGVSGNGAGLTALDGNSNTVLVSGVSADGTSAGAVVMIAGTGARKRNIPCDNQKAVVRCSTSVGSGIDVRASEERRRVKFYNLDAMLIIGRTSRISLFCWNCGLTH